MNAPQYSETQLNAQEALAAGVTRMSESLLRQTAERMPRK